MVLRVPQVQVSGAHAAVGAAAAAVGHTAPEPGTGLHGFGLISSWGVSSLLPAAIAGVEGHGRPLCFRHLLPRDPAACGEPAGKPGAWPPLVKVKICQKTVKRL